MKKYKYKVTTKWLKKKDLESYLNSLGRKGHDIISIKTGGSIIKGKFNFEFIIKKEITL